MLRPSANLKHFQTIGGGQDVPVTSRISNDSCVLITALASGVIDVYTRPCISAMFKKTEASYTKHEQDGSQPTALALQDGGAQAVSGDDLGFLHVWLTSDPEKCTSRQCGYGPVSDVAISSHYLLVCFKGTAEKDGCMVLIKKGLNVKDDWEPVKVYKPGKYSKCALSEKLKLKELNVVYFHNKSLIYEKNPQDTDEQAFEYLEGMKPFFVCRNAACFKALVFAALVQRYLVLWDPRHPVVEGKNPFLFKLKSSDRVALNKTSSASSVCDGRMFIATVFENKLCIVTLEREIERKSDTSARGENKDTLTKPTVFQAVQELISGNPEPVDTLMAAVDSVEHETELTSKAGTAIIKEDATETVSETPKDATTEDALEASPTPEADANYKEIANEDLSTPKLVARELLLPDDPERDEGHDDVVVTDGEDNEEVVEDPEGMAHEFWGLF